jgi:hypothetical protein
MISKIRLMAQFGAQIVDRQIAHEELQIYHMNAVMLQRCRCGAVQVAGTAWRSIALYL